MKTTFTLLLAMLAHICMAGNMELPESQKSITKNFATSSTPTLNVNNRYGNVDVSVWDRNAIDVQALITVGGAVSDKQAAQILGCITVEITRVGNTVSAQTVIDSKAMQQFKGVMNRANFKINLQIKVPASTYLNLENKYGHVKVESTTKWLNATVKYGNLSVGTLGQASTINVKYGHLDVAKAGDLTVNIKYGNMRMGQVEELNVVSGYGKHVVDIVKRIAGTVKYDTYAIGKIESIDLIGSGYSTFAIEELTGSLNMPDLSYGKLKIDVVGKTFKYINVGARYSNVYMGIEPANGFSVNLTASYGNVKTDGFGSQLPGLTTSGNTKAIVYTIGNNPTQRSIIVSNRYGNIELKKN